MTRPDAPGEAPPVVRVPPQRRGDYALDSIRDDLITGRLLPGARITAEDLADRLGVSHVPVREALRYLEAEGHFERDQRGRLRVKRTSSVESQDIYAVRQILEHAIHARAVPLLTEEDLGRLEAEFAAMEAALAGGDVHGYAESNRRFHFIVFDRSGQEWMIRFLTMIWDAAARYQMTLFRELGWQVPLQGQHEALLDAFRRRDATAAIRLMADHRRLAIEATRARTAAGADAISDPPPAPDSNRPLSLSRRRPATRPPARRGR